MENKIAALILYRQLFKSLGSKLSRDQLRKYYQYTVAAREKGNEQEILKNLELYLRSIKTQNQIMDAEHIGRPKDYMADVHRVAHLVGLRMPNEKKE